MHTFLVTLHVLAAVFLIGPLVVAPMTGLRALRLGDGHGVRTATRQTTVFGLLSLVVAALGAAVVPTKPDEYRFSTPSVSIAMTLYVLSLLVVMLLVVPAMTSAAKLLTPSLAVVPPTREGGPKAPVDPADRSTTGIDTVKDAPAVDTPPAAPSLTGAADTALPVAADPANPKLTATVLMPLVDQPPEIRAKLDALRGRIAATSGIVAAMLLVTTIFMVVRPFGH